MVIKTHTLTILLHLLPIAAFGFEETGLNNNFTVHNEITNSNYEEKRSLNDRDKKKYAAVMDVIRGKLSPDIDPYTAL